jgi:hypothetical protein
MLKFAERIIPSAFTRKIFLSATSNESIEPLLIRLFGVEKPKLTEKYEEADPYFALQPVLLKPFVLTDELPIQQIVEIVQEKKVEIKNLRKEKIKNNEYVPCVIIVNSVIDAIHIEEEIIKRNPDLIVRPYHGLMNKRERKIEDSHVVVGTNAIEVGIDFQCSFLIFDAGDASSFMQRFGRIGRHEIENQAPIAYAFLPTNLYEYLYEANIERLTRDELEEIIKEHYGTYPLYMDFIASEYGMLQANVFVKKLLRLLERWGEVPKTAEIRAESYINELYQLFEIDVGKKQKINRLERTQWFKAYLDSASFRSTLPSVLVYDKREERRKRMPIYETEVSTALSKGTPCMPLPEPDQIFYAVMKKFGPSGKVWLNKELPMVLIDNYDYRYTLTFSTFKRHNLYVPFVCGNEDVSIQRKRENYGFGELFRNHVGMYIRANDYDSTDWRTKKFKSDDNSQLLVFDGDALLYLYIADKCYTPEAIQQMTVRPPKTNIL